MSIIEGLLLGIVQGLTEFLPISSSGHLVLAQHFMEINESGYLFEVILHMGTLVAIIVYYRKTLFSLFIDLKNKSYDAILYFYHIIIATIPILIIGYLFKENIYLTFNPIFVIFMFIITAIIIGLTGIINNDIKNITTRMALFIGIAQAFAILPGVSRSGMTISVALLMGVKHSEAAQFAFFIAIPALLGAIILEVASVESFLLINYPSYMVGFVASALTGYLVISSLMKIIKSRKFHFFSIYCFSIAGISYYLIY